MNPKQHQWTCGIAAIVSLGLVVWISIQVTSLVSGFVKGNMSSHDSPQNRQTRQEATNLNLGINCSIDRQASEQLYRKAYANGDMLAGLHLFNLLRNKPDYLVYQEECEEIWRKSESVLYKLLEKGDFEASYLYVRAYIYDDEDPELVEYREYACDLAARSGYIPAYSLLGSMHERGKVPKPDLNTAHYWLSKAKNAGSTVGISGLGRLYTNDQFSDFNPELGISLLQEADDHGERFAALRLGEVFELGIGVEPDYEQAKEYYSKAEALGLAQATVNLARMKIEGLGEETDIDAALKLLDEVEHHWYLEEEISGLRDRINALQSD